MDLKSDSSGRGWLHIDPGQSESGSTLLCIHYPIDTASASLCVLVVALLAQLASAAFLAFIAHLLRTFLASLASKSTQWPCVALHCIAWKPG